MQLPVSLSAVRRASCWPVMAVSVFLMAVSAGMAHAQDGQLTVRVASGGVPVEGAQLSIGGAGSLTDAEGIAVLRLPAGQHRVRITRIGYATVEILVFVTSGEDSAFEVELEEEAVETEEIFVTSTRAARRIEDEPLRIEVVSREEVEEKLLMTPGDIGMLLNETAGLRVQPTAPSLGGASVRIQGLRGRYTQILSDGLPLYGGQGGALGPLQIPPMDLGQVEVIKGAASALYGSTALGGVVNLISRRPEDEREILFNQTTLGGTDGVLWFAGTPSERWGYTLLASGHRQRQADVDVDGWADLPGFRRAVVRPRVFWNDGRGSSIFATIGGMVENREGGTVSGGTTPAGTPFDEDLETRRVDVGIVGNWLLTDRRRLSARGSAMAQRHRHDFGSMVERDEHATEFAEVALAGQDGPHEWVLGAAVQHERYDSRDVSAFDFAYTTPGVFAQDEYSPVPDVTVSASVRFDHHGEYGAFMNPRVSALFRPADWVMRLSVGTGYFAPSPFTEETEAVGLARLLPFGRLEAERALSGMIDVGRSLGSWELNATLFGSRVDDALVVTPDGSGRLTLANSTEPVRTSGTELLLRYHDGPLHVTGTHVYMRSTEGVPAGAGRREVPLTPRHSVGLVGAWEAEGEGRFGVEVYYTGRQTLEENPYRDESKPYWILGFLVERRLGPARFFVNLENLFDTRQTEYDRLILPSRSPEGEWITDVWAPLDGRAINGGVRLTF